MRNRCIAMTVLFCFLCMIAQAETVDTIRFAWWGNDATIAATKNGISAFEKSQNGKMTVRPFVMNTRAEYEEWLAQQLSNGWPGDLVELDAEMLRIFGRDADGEVRFADVEPYQKQIDLKQFSYLGLVSSMLDGKICAVPVSMASHVFLWNETALKALAFKVPPSGFDELLALRDASANGATDVYPLAADAESRIAMLITYLQSKYGQLWLDEKTNRVTFTPEQISEGFAYIKGFEDMNIWPQLSEQGNIWEGFSQGRYLGCWEWDYISAELAQALPEKGKMKITAQLDNWEPYSGGFQKVHRMLAILQNATLPEESALFIGFLLNSSGGAAALADTKGTPLSISGAAVGKTRRVLDSNLTEANKVALSWSRYPMAAGFEAHALAGSGGTYEQVLMGISAGTLSIEEAASVFIREVEAALQN